ncbi:ROK family protein [Pedobacter miscanthi]|jgi:glucokinase|uniref:ROK family protein n=1 Tax=Pedobacter miscanthi TaxID=2259170 RepID=UPI0029300483|nr:ROK family protein [Pedobacter miscanthi]
MITLNNTEMYQSYAIGIDVGGSSLKCGVVNHHGEILYSTIISLKNAKTQGAIIALIVEAIQTCAKKFKNPILGVGIGFPGIIYNNKIIAGADNLPGFKQLALGEILQDVTRYNIVMDNDANLMGLGEMTYGAAKDCSDVVFLTVGTGIGGAVMIDSKLYGGFRNRGTELGHIVVQHNGIACACGGKGCLEAYASVTALLNHYQFIHPALSEMENIDGKYIVEKYLAGEEYAVKAMELHFDYLATGIISFINIFSPQKIVIGGGISEAGAFYSREIERRIKTLAVPITSTDSLVVSAKLGNKAGLLGCAAHVFQKFKAFDYAPK